MSQLLESERRSTADERHATEEAHAAIVQLRCGTDECWRVQLLLLLTVHVLLHVITLPEPRPLAVTPRCKPCKTAAVGSAKRHNGCWRSAHRHCQAAVSMAAAALAQMPACSKYPAAPPRIRSARLQLWNTRCVSERVRPPVRVPDLVVCNAASAAAHSVLGKQPRVQGHEGYCRRGSCPGGVYCCCALLMHARRDCSSDERLVVQPVRQAKRKSTPMNCVAAKHSCSRWVPLYTWVAVLA